MRSFGASSPASDLSIPNGSRILSAVVTCELRMFLYSALRALCSVHVSSVTILNLSQSPVHPYFPLFWVTPKSRGSIFVALFQRYRITCSYGLQMKKLFRTSTIVCPWWRVRNPPRVFSISFFRTYSRGHQATNLHVSSGASHDCPELRSSSAYRSFH